MSNTTPTSSITISTLQTGVLKFIPDLQIGGAYSLALASVKGVSLLLGLVARYDLFCVLLLHGAVICGRC